MKDQNNEILILQHNMPDLNAFPIPNSGEFPSRCQHFLEELLSSLGYTGWQLSLVFCDDTFIAELNQRYRNRAGPTDILSFPADPALENPAAGGGGDLILSLPGWYRNVSLWEVPPEEELRRLLIHGVLHLAGWEHSIITMKKNLDFSKIEDKMIQTQEKILKEILQKPGLLSS